MGRTIAQKIFDDHRVGTPGTDMHVIRLDAVFCHEITTPPAILDLEQRGKDRVFDPARIKVVIDHVSPAKDSQTALQGKILRAWARRHGIVDFFDADAAYDMTIDHDVSTLTPMVTFGYRPDNVKPVSEMADTPVDQVYIGSCTNGRISDLRIAARVMAGKRISDTVRAIVSPATPKVYDQALDEGLIKTFMDAGFCVTPTPPAELAWA